MCGIDLADKPYQQVPDLGHAGSHLRLDRRPFDLGMCSGQLLLMDRETNKVTTLGLALELIICTAPNPRGYQPL